MVDTLSTIKQGLLAHKRMIQGTAIIFLVLTALGWLVEYTHSLGAPLLFFYEIDVSPTINCIRAPCPSVDPQYSPAYGAGVSMFLFVIDVAVAAVIYQILRQIKTQRDRIMALDQRILGLGAVSLMFIIAGIGWELTATTVANSTIIAVLPAAETVTILGAIMASPVLWAGAIGIPITVGAWILGVVLATTVRDRWGQRRVWLPLSTLIFVIYSGILSYGLPVDQSTIFTVASIPPFMIGQTVLRTAGLPIQHGFVVGLVLLYPIILAGGNAVSRLYRLRSTRDTDDEETDT